jgi:hypothetical protein
MADLTKIKTNGPWGDYELYDAAEAYYSASVVTGDPDPLREAIRFACRQVAIAILNKAYELKVDPEVYEELRKVAARVATD